MILHQKQVPIVLMDQLQACITEILYLMLLMMSMEGFSLIQIGYLIIHMPLHLCFVYLFLTGKEW